MGWPGLLADQGFRNHQGWNSERLQAARTCFEFRPKRGVHPAEEHLSCGVKGAVLHLPATMPRVRYNAREQNKNEGSIFRSCFHLNVFFIIL